MNQLPDILKQLRNIAPDPIFTDRSRAFILHMPKNTASQRADIPTLLFRAMSSSYAVFGGFIFVSLLGAAVYLQAKSPAYFARIDLNSLDKEESTIQIQLKELGAYEKSEQLMQFAMQDGPSSDNQTKEPAGEPVNEPANQDIDKALELML